MPVDKRESIDAATDAPLQLERALLIGIADAACSKGLSRPPPRTRISCG